jgi:hypothetical protein
MPNPSLANALAPTTRAGFSYTTNPIQKRPRRAESNRGLLDFGWRCVGPLPGKLFCPPKCLVDPGGLEPAMLENRIEVGSGSARRISNGMGGGFVRVTPAMEAAIPDHVWSNEEIVGAMELN